MEKKNVYSEIFPFKIYLEDTVPRLNQQKLSFLMVFLKV